ncbi:MAG: hypothetical protein AAFU61_18125, partial [Pseudomonadota bacterium]
MPANYFGPGYGFYGSTGASPAGWYGYGPAAGQFPTFTPGQPAGPRGAGQMGRGQAHMQGYMDPTQHFGGYGMDYGQAPCVSPSSALFA